MPDTLAQRYVKACETNNIGLRVRLENELEAEGARENERLSAPDAPGKAALWYARQGIAVFPCEPRGKKPLLGSAHRGESSSCRGECGRDGHGLHDATAHLERVRAWWQATPAANIGAPTGLTFDVIDIDGPIGVGQVFGEHENGERLELPERIGHSLTSRVGGHHMFIAPTGRGNGASIMPSVDYRGAGGYVILPPSVGANGVRYMWTRPLKVTA